jgi:hypothetical protein
VESGLKDGGDSVKKGLVLGGAAVGTGTTVSAASLPGLFSGVLAAGAQRFGRLFGGAQQEAQAAPQYQDTPQYQALPQIQPQQGPYSWITELASQPVAPQPPITASPFVMPAALRAAAGLSESYAPASPKTPMYAPGTPPYTLESPPGSPIVCDETEL